MTSTRCERLDVQFPLDKFFDVIEIHSRAWVLGTKGVQSRAIAIMVQAGQCFLARFGCEVGLSEAAAGLLGVRCYARPETGCAYIPPFASDISAMNAG